MEFIKTSDPEAGVDALLSRLMQELEGGKNVLWLLCGGSNVVAEATILKKIIAAKLAENLSVMLMDERYGPAGHPDSNWQQLQDSGCDFAAVQATPVLSEPLKSLDETAASYSKKVQTELAGSDVVIGLFGMGADGHTAGILPGSPAALAASELVAGYDSPPFQRITLTRQALLNVDAAYVFAFGENKKPALLDLQANQKSFVDMPAKLHWELPEAYIYNDQVGEAQ